MNKKLFTELIKSVREMDEVVRGERAASRVFHVDGLSIEELRCKIDQSQPKRARSRPKGYRP